MKAEIRHLIPSTLLAVLLLLAQGCGKDSEKVHSSEMNSKGNEHEGMDRTHGNEQSTKDNANDADRSEHVMIRVPTMQCQTCKENIESAVKVLDGIKSVEVDKNEKVAHINFEKGKTDLEKIETVITEAGYDANDKKAVPDAYNRLDDCCKLPKDRKKK